MLVRHIRGTAIPALYRQFCLWESNPLPSNVRGMLPGSVVHDWRVTVHAQAEPVSVFPSRVVVRAIALVGLRQRYPRGYAPLPGEPQKTDDSEGERNRRDVEPVHVYSFLAYLQSMHLIRLGAG